MKKYIIPIISIIFSLSCFIVYDIIGSHVADDGLLVEPFGLIPVGFSLFTIGIIIGLLISIWSLFHNPKKHDKWIFGIFITIFVVFSVYITASIFYLTEQANKEISQNENKPSREAYPDCKWEKVVGAGLELWGQSCDYVDKKLKVNTSETLPGVFLEDVTNGSPFAIEQLIQVFELKDKSIGSVIPLLSDNEDWKVSDKCAFTKVDNSRTDVTRYTLMPTGDALKKFESDGKNEPINSTCAGYGMGNSGVQYFEIYSSNPSKALFINVGQELPMFDENTILVR